MSTRIEEQLTAALHARADAVQPEDLRPLVVPDGPRRRSGRAVAVLAAAACTAVVAGSLGLGALQDGDSERPVTDQPSEPVVDLDGDGREDSVLLQRGGPNGLSRVVVELATGERVRTGWNAWEKPRLLTTADFEGDGRSEIVLRVDGPQRPPVVLDLYDGRLLPEPFPEQQVNGWSPVSPRNRWAVIDGQVVSWELSGGDRPGDRVRYWEWESLEDRFSPVPLEARCLTAEVGPPVPCTSGPEQGLDVGPRGDLPSLFPAVRERVGVGGWVRFAYQTDDDTFQLRGDLSPGQDRVEAGEVELVVTVDGVEHAAPVPAGPRPRVSPQTVASRGAPGFLVMQESKGATRMTVYSFWNGELRALRTPDGQPFGASVNVPFGTDPYRTWITEDGRLFTAEELDTPSGRNRVFAWSDDLGPTLDGSDLGEVCIDWDAEPTDYGRCPD